MAGYYEKISYPQYTSEDKSYLVSSKLDKIIRDHTLKYAAAHITTYQCIGCFDVHLATSGKGKHSGDNAIKFILLKIRDWEVSVTEFANEASSIDPESGQHNAMLMYKYKYNTDGYKHFSDMLRRLFLIDPNLSPFKHMGA